MDTLKNRLVLIDPTFKTDPANKQGKFGRIIGRMEEVHLVFVRFPNGEKASYDTAELLVLNPLPILEAFLFNMNDPFLKTDKKKIAQIARLVRSGKEYNLKRAMQLAVSETMLKKFTVVNLREFIEMGLQDYQEQLKNGG